MPLFPYVFIDGNNLAYRSFYGVKQLTSPEGTPVNAIYGFFNSLVHLREQYPFEHFIVCFDCKGSQKRLQLLQEYKANRPPMPSDFKVQIPYIKQIIPLLGGLCCEKKGIEADDLIGAWCTWAEQQTLPAAIVSGDKDLMQCVNDHISQIMPHPTQRWMLHQRAEVFEKMGVYPEQIIDYLTLIGDSADNYLGIAGVGSKTAASWLNTYGTLDQVLQHTQQIKPERFREKLQQSRELLERNHLLASLDRNQAHIQTFLPQLNTVSVNTAALYTLLAQLHLQRLQQKIHTFFQAPQQQTQSEFLF